MTSTENEFDMEAWKRWWNSLPPDEKFQRELFIAGEEFEAAMRGDFIDPHPA